jgi:hypothetical protein
MNIRLAVLDLRADSEIRYEAKRCIFQPFVSKVPNDELSFRHDYSLILSYSRGKVILICVKMRLKYPVRLRLHWTRILKCMWSYVVRICHSETIGFKWGRLNCMRINRTTTCRHARLFFGNKIF